MAFFFCLKLTPSLYVSMATGIQCEPCCGRYRPPAPETIVPMDQRPVMH